MKTEPKEVMNVNELADFLSVHRSTIYRNLRDGTLPAFKVGSDWKFRRSSIEAWMTKQEKGGGK